MRKVISAGDVAKLAAENQLELVIGEGTVITPLALDRCREMGLKVCLERAGTGSPCRGSGIPAGQPASSSSLSLVSSAPPVNEREVRRVVQRLLLALWREEFCPRRVAEITALVLARLGEGR